MKFWAILVSVVFTIGFVLSEAKGQVYLPIVSGDTPTSTPMPTPTPTIAVLNNHTSYTDRNGHLYILGEIKNTTSSNISTVFVRANLFNELGEQVASGNMLLRLDIVEVSESTCFQIGVRRPPEWSYYEFQTAYTPITVQPRQLVIHDVTGAPDQSNENYYEVVGKARNENGKRVHDFLVIGTLYNRSNQVIDCSSSDVGGRLEPNQSSSWMIDFGPIAPGSAHSYKFNTQAH